MAAIKIRQIAAIINQVSKAIVIIVVTAMQAEEVAVLIALVALQEVHVLQEYHKTHLRNSIFFESFRGKF
jgi:copper homeostasis protein CutC